jgi:hypothetical protein
MNMYRAKQLHIVLLFGCLNITAFAQNTFAFKAKVIHNKKGIMKDFTILVNSEVATTNDAGIFIIALNNDVTHIKVALEQTNYTVLYPTDGYVAVPRDLNDVPEIIIGSPQDNTYLNQYLAIYKEIKSNNSTTGSELSALAKQLDSLQQILLQLNYTETDLRSAKEMQDGRDRYYPEITQNLVEFVDKAFDLQRALQNLTSFAFDNAAARQNMYNAVTDYNHIRNTLSEQRFNYEKFIGDYWQDDSLTSHFRSLIVYALDSFHQGKILPLQNDITQINQYLTNNNKDLKEKIQQNIAKEMPGLTDALAELKNRHAAFQTDFKN